MKNNIRYKDFTKLMSHDEVMKYKKGSCHDQVMFELEELSKMNLSPKALFFMEYDNNNQGGMTHSFVYYEKDSKVYWFENAWGDNKGIHKFDSVKDIKESIKEYHKSNKFGNINKYPNLEITSFKKHIPGESLQDFVSKCLSESVKEYTINESKKKILNDKGEEVPEKCPKCGADVKIYIKGEPVYLCSNEKCNKYFGTVPCSKKDGKNMRLPWQEMG